MIKLKQDVLITCFTVTLIVGLLLIFNSPDLAEVRSRQYTGGKNYSIDSDDVSRNMQAIATTGCVVSLLAGYGLITIITKKD